MGVAFKVESGTARTCLDKGLGPVLCPGGHSHCMDRWGREQELGKLGRDRQTYWELLLCLCPPGAADALAQQQCSPRPVLTAAEPQALQLSLTRVSPISRQRVAPPAPEGNLPLALGRVNSGGALFCQQDLAPGHEPILLQPIPYLLELPHQATVASCRCSGGMDRTRLPACANLGH